MPKMIDPEPVPGMPRLLGSAQVRKLIGCSQQALDLYVRAGKVHMVTGGVWGGRRLYPSQQFQIDDQDLQAHLDLPIPSLAELERALVLYRDPHARAAAEAAYVKPEPKPLDSRQNRFSNEPSPGTRQPQPSAPAQPQPSAPVQRRTIELPELYPCARWQNF
jgi:hypothetical protein